MKIDREIGYDDTFCNTRIFETYLSPREVLNTSAKER